MASLILHNLPEATIKQLEERAQRHSRSVEEEVIELLALVKKMETHDQVSRREVESSSPLGAALRRFITQDPAGEEPTPLEALRDPHPGREDDLWQD